MQRSGAHCLTHDTIPTGSAQGTPLPITHGITPLGTNLGQRAGLTDRGRGATRTAVRVAGAGELGRAGGESRSGGSGDVNTCEGREHGAWFDNPYGRASALAWATSEQRDDTDKESSESKTSQPLRPRPATPVRGQNIEIRSEDGDGDGASGACGAYGIGFGRQPGSGVGGGGVSREGKVAGCTGTGVGEGRKAGEAIAKKLEFHDIFE